jgi:hypothetical protein
MPDKLKYHDLHSEDFIRACHDYHYLIDRHYPERGVLKLVGDRYRLGGDQRTVLYRGISSRERSAHRKSLLVSDIAGAELAVDGYNVLFTLLNYRRGKITFISTDHFLRDAGSLHGRLRDEKTFAECVALLADFLSLRQPTRVDVYLDSPVSHSEQHAHLIRERIQKVGLITDCHVIKSADWALRQRQEGFIATSDTAIIDKSKVPVIDLSKEVLEHAYRARFLDINLIIPPV